MREKCEKMQSELNSFWPEWQVIECFEEGASGDLFRIRKDSFGIRVESSLKVIRYDESDEYHEPFCPADNNESEEALLRSMSETRTLFSSPDETERGYVPEVPEPSSVRIFSQPIDRFRRDRKENDRQEKEDISADRPTMSESAEFSGLLQSKEEIHAIRPGQAENDGRTIDIPEVFLKEIQIMEALRGTPNVVIVEEYYCKKEGTISSLFVRMELLASFRKVLIRHEENPARLSVKEVLKIGKDISTALIYFEKKGIRHRNIKPDNLFVDAFGNYKVGNSGVLRRKETPHFTFAMAEIGAFTYTAPEVFKGQGYNDTVDTYALGLVLYQVLNKGRIPFLPASGTYGTRDTEKAIDRRLQGEPLPPLADIRIGDGDNTEAAAELDCIVRKACAPDRKDRFQTAKELYDALSAWEAAASPDIYHRNQSDARFAGHHGGQMYSLPDEGEKRNDSSENHSKDNSNKEKYNLNNYNKEKQKTRSGAFIPGIAAFFVTLLTVLLAVFILNRNRLTGTDSVPQSGTEPSSGTLSDREAAAGAHNESTEDDEAIADTEAGKIPVTDVAEKEDEGHTIITDSWEEIIESGEDGTYMDKYQIGDLKELDLGQEGLIMMELVAKYEDRLSDYTDDETFSHMTWIARTPLNSRHSMYAGETKESNWLKSDMRSWLRESILPLFPEEVRSNIKEVDKDSLSADDKETEPSDYDADDLVFSDDTIWIPSFVELFHKHYDDTSYPVYKIAFSDNASREINRNDASGSWWWLRSAYHNDSFYCVNPDGSWDYKDVNEEGGVIIGFCL